MPQPRFPRPSLAERLAQRALDGPPLLLTGPLGAGKSTLLREIASVLSSRGVAVVELDLFTAASSPEHFVRSALAAIERAGVGSGELGPIREALTAGRSKEAAAVAALCQAFARMTRAGSRPVVLLLDEPTEIQSLAYYAGLRQVAEDLAQALSQRPTGALLATSFPTRAAARFRSIASEEVPRFSATEVQVEAANLGLDTEALIRLSGGRPTALVALLEATEPGGSLEDGWVAAMGPGAALERAARAHYEALLLRSRGYGMTKAVLAEVARDEGCTLTSLFRRLQRSPGAVKDYLSVALEVDALKMEWKSYVFVDPVLSEWVRLYGDGTTPSREARQARARALLTPSAVEPARARRQRARAAVGPVEPSPSRPPEPLAGSAALETSQPKSDKPRQGPRQRRDTLMEID